MVHTGKLRNRQSGYFVLLLNLIFLFMHPQTTFDLSPSWSADGLILGLLSLLRIEVQKSYSFACMNEAGWPY